MLKVSSKVLRKFQSRKVSLKIAKEGDLIKVEILCDTDATRASIKCGSSQGAYLISPCGNGNVVPVAWQSKSNEKALSLQKYWH